MICDFDTWVAEERVCVPFGIPTNSTILCSRIRVRALCNSDQYLLTGSSFSFNHAGCHVHYHKGVFLCYRRV